MPSKDTATEGAPSINVRILSNTSFKAITSRRETLLNKEIIAINQDQLGKQARVVSDKDNKMIFAKQLSGGKWAIGLFNRDGKEAKDIAFDLKEIGLTGKVEARDLWNNKNLGSVKEQISFKVDPHACKVIILSN